MLNQKGGSGKTTIATHLARALQLDGAAVLLVDSDPQGSTRDWAAVREDQPLTVVGIDRPTILNAKERVGGNRQQGGTPDRTGSRRTADQVCRAADRLGQARSVSL